MCCVPSRVSLASQYFASSSARAGLYVHTGERYSGQWREGQMHGRRVHEPPPPPAPCQGVTLIRHLLNLKSRTTFLNAYCAVLNAFERRGVFTQPDGTTYDGEFDSDCCQGNLVAIRWRLLTRLLSHFTILFSPPFAADITHSHIHAAAAAFVTPQWSSGRGVLTHADGGRYIGQWQVVLPSRYCAS